MVAYNYDLPTAEDSDLAREASAKIIPFLRDHKPLEFLVSEKAEEQLIKVPTIAVPLIQRVMEALAAGHGVTIIPRHAELTTMEAADILNVSRPYLVKLLDANEIPFHKVGRHRRIRLDDLLDYKRRIDRAREAILDQMVREAEELGLYD